MKNIILIFTLLSTMISAQDFANFSRYKKQNQELISKNIIPNTVFMGDSITEAWVTSNPDFFIKNNFAGRGIGGQVTSQMLIRFDEDVIKLKPNRVIILAGINDIAENQGPISLEKISKNIILMVELAKKNNMKIVLCSVLPAYDFGWRKNKQPAEKVITLNKMITDYARKNDIQYIDFHSEMKDSRNGLDKIYTQDEVHPNKKGYEKMEEILMKNLN